ncbi:MAG: hypothetical protein JXQ73_32710 [Phycisphaerae bacterium]|nr:hypothetical protein [Phycisphaerae bacterium]
MAKRRNNFVVGLTVLVMLALTIAVVIYVGASDLRGKPTRTMTIRFAPTLALPPLKEDSPILFAGRQVGRISELWLAPAELTDKAKGEKRNLMCLFVRATVRSDLDLRSDCEILPEGPILGGAGLLRIQDQGKSDKTLGPNDVVEGQGMGGFAAVTEQISEIGGLLTRELDAQEKGSLMGLIKIQLDAREAGSLMAKLLQTMTDLNTISGSLKDQFDPKQGQALLAKLHVTMDHINVITGELQNQMDPKARSALLGKLQIALDTVNNSLQDVSGMLAENRPTIKTTLDNVQETTRTLNDNVVKTIADELNAENTKSLMAKIHRSVDLMTASLKDLNEITESTNEVVTLNKGTLDKILSNFKETSDHLTAAAKDLRRNPWRLLYRPTLVETKELNIFDAARAFAEAATRLDDATARLEGLTESREGKVPVDDPELKVIRSELQDTFKKFSAAEAALWKSLNIKP